MVMTGRAADHKHLPKKKKNTHFMCIYIYIFYFDCHFTQNPIKVGIKFFLPLSC